MRRALPETCLIPEGPFLMGSDHGTENEAPVHIVRVDAFAIERYPVTRQQYALFLDETRHPPPLFWEEPVFQIPEQPVVGVNWFEAVAYCNWMSASMGRLWKAGVASSTAKLCGVPWARAPLVGTIKNAVVTIVASGFWKRIVFLPLLVAEADLVGLDGLPFVELQRHVERTLRLVHRIVGERFRRGREAGHILQGLIDAVDDTRQQQAR